MTKGTTHDFAQFSDGTFILHIHSGKPITPRPYEATVEPLAVVRPCVAEFEPGRDVCEHCIAEIVLGRTLPREGELIIIESPRDVLLNSIVGQIDFIRGGNAESGYIYHSLKRGVFTIYTQPTENADGSFVEVCRFGESTNLGQLQQWLMEYVDRTYPLDQVKSQDVKQPATPSSGGFHQSNPSLLPHLEGPDTLTPTIHLVLGYLTGAGAHWLDGNVMRVVHDLGEDVFRVGERSQEDGTERKTLAYVDKNTDWEYLRKSLKFYADCWYGRAKNNDAASRWVGGDAASALDEIKDKIATGEPQRSDKLEASKKVALVQFQNFLHGGEEAYLLEDLDTQTLRAVNADTFNSGLGVVYSFQVIVNASKLEALPHVVRAVDAHIQSARDAERRKAEQYQKKHGPRPLTLLNGQRVDPDKLAQEREQYLGQRGYRWVRE
jgi:hypothetical protein